MINLRLSEFHDNDLHGHDATLAGENFMCLRLEPRAMRFANDWEYIHVGMRVALT